MTSAIAIITCVVGIIGLLIGIATYIGALLSKARENGALMEKVDYLVKSFDEQKRELKERHNAVSALLDEHTKDITNIKARLEHLEKDFEGNGK